GLPAEGQIVAGQLDWPRADPPLMLAEGRLLGIAVDLNHSGQVRSPAHVEAEFGRSDLRVYSLLGYARIAYPRGWRIPFSRQELEPRWGAWSPAVLTLSILGVATALMATWAALAWVYCWPVWLIGFFADRDLTVRASRRLAG